MNRHPRSGTKTRRTAAVMATAVSITIGTSCFGDGGIDEARRRRKQIEQTRDPSAVENELLAAANAVRAQKGLGELQAHPELVNKARGWSVTMAREQRLYHSLLADGVTVPWVKLAENVGQGGTARSLHESFVASPRHYANMTDPTLTHIGVGAAQTSEGILFVTEVFMEAGRPAPATPAPKSPPRTVPPRVVGAPPGARRITARPPRTAVRDNPSGTTRQPSPRLLRVLHQLQELGT